MRVGRYLLRRLPVLWRECGEPESCGQLPRRGGSGVTGKNPSSRVPGTASRDRSRGNSWPSITHSMIHNKEIRCLAK